MSSKQAARLAGYSTDYIGQLCRVGKLDCTRVGRIWYVTQDSILAHKKMSEQIVASQTEQLKKEVVRMMAAKNALRNRPTLGQILIADNSDRLLTYHQDDAPLIPELKKHQDVAVHVEPSVSRKITEAAPSPSGLIIRDGRLPFAHKEVVRKSVAGALALSMMFGTIYHSDSTFGQTTYQRLSKLSQSVALYFDDPYIPSDNQIAGIYTGAQTAAQKVYLGISSLFGNKTQTQSEVAVNPPASNTIVATSSSTTPEPAPIAVVPVATTKPTPSQPYTPAPTRTVVQNNTVVEKTTERVIVGDISRKEVEDQIQALANRLSSQMYQLSTGGGGSVTNVYQQIAHSSRIDQLASVAISGSTWAGGTISNATLSGISISDDLTIDGDLSVDDLTIAGALAIASTSPAAPSGKLYSDGTDLYWSGTALSSSASSWSSSGSDVYRSAGNVGVGTSSPYAKLSVEGDAIFGSTVTASSFSATSTATSTFSGGLSVDLFNVSSTTASSTFANGINLSAGCFAVNGSCITGGGGGSFTGSGTAGYLTAWTSSTGLTATGSPTVGYIVATSTTASTLPYASSTSVTISGTLFVGSDGISDLTGTGLTNTSGALTLVTSGNWTGTFDNQEGSYYLDANNHTNFGTPFYSYFSATTTTALSEGDNLYFTNARADARINATTTIGTLTTLANLTTTGALNAGSITSGFGSIDIGADALTAGAASLSSLSVSGASTLSGLTLFGQASSTRLSIVDRLYIGGTSTTTIVGNGATSTFSGGVETASLNITSTTASSTFANGINLSAGCFAVNGSCITGGGSGSGTVSSGTTGQFAYYASNSTTLTGTSTLFVSTAEKIGIGTTSPYAKLSVVGPVVAEYFHATSTTATSTFAGGLETNAFLVTGSATSTIMGGLGVWGTLAIGTTGTGAGNMVSVTKDGYERGINIEYSPNSGDTFATSTGIYLEATPGTGLDMVGLHNDYAIDYSATESIGLLNTFYADAGNSIFTGVENRIQWIGGGNNIGYGVKNILTQPDRSYDDFTYYGVYNDVSNKNESGTSATSTVYGTYSVGSTHASIHTFYGNYIASAATSTAGTQYGTYVDMTAGTATKYPGIFLGGNVGIGTTSPYAKLSVEGNAVIGGNLRVASITSTTTATSTFAGGILISGGGLSLSTAICSDFNNGGKLTTDSSGNVICADDTSGGAGGSGGGTWSTTTSTHSGRLVNYSGNTTDIVAIGANATTSAEFFFDPNTNYAYLASGGLTITGGNVGVGTTSPYSRLSVWSSGSTAGQAFEVVNNASSTLMKLLDSGTAYFLGNVGVGTTSPYAKLSVAGEAVAEKFTATSTTATTTLAGGLNVGSGSILYDLNSGLTSIAGLQTGPMNFDTDAGIVSWIDMPVTATSSGLVQSYTANLDGQPALTVYGESDTGGNVNKVRVGIGTTSPTARLTVWASTTSATGRALDVVSNASTTLFTILDNGLVGIGTTTPWANLSASGTVAFLGLSTAAGTPDALCINPGTKEVTVNTGTQTCTVSSARFKQDISYDSTPGLSTLLALKPATFKYNNTENERVGLIAEDVQIVDDRFIFTENASTTPRGVRYEDLSVLSVSAIKDLSDILQIQTSAASSTKLTSLRLDTIESRLTALEQKSGVATVVANAAEWIGNTISATIGSFKQLVIGDAQTATAITVFDKNGNPGCMMVEDVNTGTFTITPGACTTSSGNSEPSPSSSSQSTENASSTPAADTEAPVITVLGNNPATIAVGSSYVDLGATMTDNVSSNIALRARVNGGELVEIGLITLDTSVDGEFTITYEATDAAGNTGTAERTVIVGEGIQAEVEEVPIEISEETPPVVEEVTATTTSATSTTATSTSAN